MLLDAGLGAALRTVPEITCLLVVASTGIASVSTAEHVRLVALRGGLPRSTRCLSPVTNSFVALQQAAESVRKGEVHVALVLAINGAAYPPAVSTDSVVAVLLTSQSIAVQQHAIILDSLTNACNLSLWLAGPTSADPHTAKRIISTVGVTSQMRTAPPVQVTQLVGHAGAADFLLALLAGALAIRGSDGYQRPAAVVVDSTTIFTSATTSSQTIADGVLLLGPPPLAPEAAMPGSPRRSSTELLAGVRSHPGSPRRSSLADIRAASSAPCTPQRTVSRGSLDASGKPALEGLETPSILTPVAVDTLNPSVPPLLSFEALALRVGGGLSGSVPSQDGIPTFTDSPGAHTAATEAARSQSTPGLTPAISDTPRGIAGLPLALIAADTAEELRLRLVVSKTSDATALAILSATCCADWIEGEKTTDCGCCSPLPSAAKSTDSATSDAVFTSSLQSIPPPLWQQSVSSCLQYRSPCSDTRPCPRQTPFSPRSHMTTHRGYRVIGQQARILATGSPAERGADAVLLFVGMGAQWRGMAGAIWDIPVCRATLIRSYECVREYGVDVSDALSADRAGVQVSCMRAFAAITAMNIALYHLLLSLGLRADVIMGHSLGEVAAAYADGALTLCEAMRIACVLGRGLQAVSGSTAAVALAPAHALRWASDDVHIAAYNAPDATVVSGPPLEVAGLVRRCREADIAATILQDCNVPFHSLLLHPLATPLQAAIRAVFPHERPFSSRWRTTSGQPGQSCGPRYFVQNMLAPVQFSDAVAALDPRMLIVEIGPDAPFSSLLKNSFTPARDVVSLLRRRDPTPARIAEVIGELYVRGVIDGCAPLPPGYGSRTLMPRLVVPHSPCELTTSRCLPTVVFVSEACAWFFSPSPVALTLEAVSPLLFEACATAARPGSPWALTQLSHFRDSTSSFEIGVCVTKECTSSDPVIARFAVCTKAGKTLWRGAIEHAEVSKAEHSRAESQAAYISSAPETVDAHPLTAPAHCPLPCSASAACPAPAEPSATTAIGSSDIDSTTTVWSVATSSTASARATAARYLPCEALADCSRAEGHPPHTAQAFRAVFLACRQRWSAAAVSIRQIDIQPARPATTLTQGSVAIVVSHGADRAEHVLQCGCVRVRVRVSRSLVRRISASLSRRGSKSDLFAADSAV